MPKKPTPPSMEDRMKTKREELVKLREQVHDQLVGINNQIFLIDQLLNPPPEPTPEPPEEVTDGVDMPEGTV